jgi:hypothetical protein
MGLLVVSPKAMKQKVGQEWDKKTNKKSVSS